LDKTRVNFVIDCLLMIVLAAIAGIGFMLAWNIPRGRVRNVLYGHDKELFFLGLDRQGWSDVHLVLALVMLGLMVLHIILHWNQIVCMYRRLIGSAAARRALAWVFSILCLLLLFYPLAIKPEIRQLAAGESGFRGMKLQAAAQQVGREDTIEPVVERIPVQKQPKEKRPQQVEAGAQESAPEEKKQSMSAAQAGIQVEEHEHKRLGTSSTIRGFMTLSEVSQEQNVPVSYLLKGLSLPLDTPSSERLGRLRRVYGFTMSDLERLIESYHQGKPK